GEGEGEMKRREEKGERAKRGLDHAWLTPLFPDDHLGEEEYAVARPVVEILLHLRQREGEALLAVVQDRRDTAQLVERREKLRIDRLGRLVVDPLPLRLLVVPANDLAHVRARAQHHPVPLLFYVLVLADRLEIGVDVLQAIHRVVELLRVQQMAPE